jgi:hypothetical protein
VAAEIERSTLGRRIAAHESVSAEVLRKSREGETPLSVAKWLQEELLLFTEAGIEELAQAVKVHFLAEVPLEERLDIHRVGRSAIAATVARQKRQAGSRERLEVLLDLQMGRIELGHRVEAAEGAFSPALGNEVEVARRIAMNLHEVEQVTGADSAPKTGSGALSGELGAKLGKLFHVLLDAIPDKTAENGPKTADIEVENDENDPQKPVSDPETVTDVEFRPVG